MPKLQALIFDVDGTLAETEELHRCAFNEAFAAGGLTWHWDRALYQALLAVTGGKERIRHYINAYNPEDGRALSDADIRALHAEKTKRYGAMVESGMLCFRPGVEALVVAAHAAGLRLAIATTTSAANVTALLQAVSGGALAGCFEVIGAAEQAPRKKPAPDVYLWVLERMGLEASACLAFEDSENGLAAGLAAGIPTLVTRSAYTPGERFEGALAVLPDLAGVSLAELVRAFNAG